MDFAALKQQQSAVPKLALHQSQRCQLIPTISILLGPAIAARQLWSQEFYNNSRDFRIYSYNSILDLFKEWWQTASKIYDFRELALKKIAPLSKRTPEQLSAWLDSTSGYQRQLFWQDLMPMLEDVAFLKLSIESHSFPNWFTQLSKDRSMTLGHPEHCNQLLDIFKSAVQLLSPSSIPGLLILLPEECDISSSIAAISSLIQLVENIPNLPIGINLSSDRGRKILQQFPDSRAKTILRNGLIELPYIEPANIHEWLNSHSVSEANITQSILHLADKFGATQEVLETALRIANSPQTSDCVYRSCEEQFLFQFLETRPTTVGHFQVNARLDIDFGGRSMEVDFLDTESKIAIELDGYYHFQSRDNYRRDRRKDRLLQEHGFLVLRFLSEDVVKDLEGILDVIDRALLSRQSIAIDCSEA